jgi:hypothetical protein
METLQRISIATVPSGKVLVNARLFKDGEVVGKFGRTVDTNALAYVLLAEWEAQGSSHDDFNPQDTLSDGE